MDVRCDVMRAMFFEDGRPSTDCKAGRLWRGIRGENPQTTYENRTKMDETGENSEKNAEIRYACKKKYGNPWRFIV